MGFQHSKQENLIPRQVETIYDTNFKIKKTSITKPLKKIIDLNFEIDFDIYKIILKTFENFKKKKNCLYISEQKLGNFRRINSQGWIDYEYNFNFKKKTFNHLLNCNEKIMDHIFNNEQKHFDYIIFYKNDYDSYCVIKIFKYLTNNILPNLNHKQDWLINVYIYFSDNYLISEKIFNDWKSKPNSYP